MVKKYGTFAEALSTASGFGDNLSVDDVLNKEIVVESFELLDTEWGPAARIKAQVDGEEESILTWSGVLIKQLSKVEEQLPLQGAIEKEKRYYTFV